MTHDPNIQLLIANTRIAQAQADAANERLARRIANRSIRADRGPSRPRRHRLRRLDPDPRHRARPAPGGRRERRRVAPPPGRQGRLTTMPHLRDAGAAAPRRPSRAGAALRWFQLEPRAVPDAADRRLRADAAAERPALAVRSSCPA